MSTTSNRETTTHVYRRLCALSEAKRVDPSTAFQWDARADEERPAMTSELCALHMHPVERSLSDAQRWKLQLLEAGNFFSVNIAGENALREGIRERLAEGEAPWNEYLEHFLREEEAHTRVFERFCRSYVGHVHPCPQPRFRRDHAAGEDDFLFFARVLVFEEIADAYNRRIAADEDVWPLVRAIHRYHAEDEARHLAFGRTVVADLWNEHASAWSPEIVHGVRTHLSSFREATLRSYVNPRVFREAGIPGDALALRDEVLRSERRAALHAELTAKADRFFRKIGVFE